jgi:[ribosomal protein S5]-alanine N-acetyltransferase
MDVVLRTPRLLLQPVDGADVEALHTHWNRPLVGRWLWDGNPVDHPTVVELVDDSRRTFDLAGWGLWAVRSDENTPLVGVCGLRSSETADDGVELLYSLDPAWWGLGLATEAAAAVLEYAFGTLHLPRVLATTDDGNHASVRVLRRLGMRAAERMTVGERTFPCFVIDRGERDPRAWRHW